MIDRKWIGHEYFSGQTLVCSGGPGGF